MADYYLGEIRAFAGTYAPVDWMMCNGATLPVQGNEALFSLIGSTYGSNGPTDFKVPDLRGRLTVGQGLGIGLTSRVIGSVGGAETVALTEAQLPAHNHNLTVSTVTSPASVNAPGNTSYLGVVNSSAGAGVGYVPGNATGATVRALDTQVLTNTGGSQAHANIMPFLALNYIICVNGLYPVRP